MNAQHFRRPYTLVLPVRVRRPASAIRLFVPLILALVCLAGTGATVSATLNVVQFNLSANPPFVNCIKGASGTPTASVTVTRGAVNDSLEIVLHNFKPDLDFDLFTVQNSIFLANGTTNPSFTNFGLAWYQSDIQTDGGGSADVTIKTILLDQIFGFDPAVSLAPTNTFHVGFWFNNPQDAVPCGFNAAKPTPFNGEHNAGPLAMISVPNATTGQGPLDTIGLSSLPHTAATGPKTGGFPAGTSASRAAVSSVQFGLRANASFLACISQQTGTPTAWVTVTRGALNDTLEIVLNNFKPNLAFDLFTVQNSTFLANGTRDPAFTNFGLAWYQSDIEVDGTGHADVTIKTILLDQIFGFDPVVNLAPTNTFHVGFWFNNPQDAAACGFTGTTPFNGDHNAGPLAMISVPNAGGIGPLASPPDDLPPTKPPGPPSGGSPHTLPGSRPNGPPLSGVPSAIPSPRP